ncbi:MAG: type II toxin-antitoxin system PemK/MazF family toxin [Bacteroidales bacterium]|nr:type II toxin-antitoxin system PemK/MazF family toxin [Bacteroidales bacterium]
MKQRDIWLADLNPFKGSEQKGIRPVVVISGNAMNDNLSIGIVCLVTKVVKKYAGCLVLEKNAQHGLDEESEVITFQIRTIARERLVRKLGEISKAELELLKSGLQDILTY